MAGALMISIFLASLFVIGMAFCELETSMNNIEEAIRLLKTLVEAID